MYARYRFAVQVERYAACDGQPRNGVDLHVLQQLNTSAVARVCNRGGEAQAVFLLTVGGHGNGRRIGTGTLRKCRKGQK